MSALANRWPLALLRAFVAVLFGAFAIAWPGLTVAVLVVVFAVYACVDGALALAAGFSAVREHRGWLGLIVRGAIGIAAGLTAVFWPEITAVALVYLVAIWAIFAGVAEFIAGILVRGLTNEVFLILAGAVSMLFGIATIAHPGVGALAIVWVLGGYAIVYGLLLAVFAMRLRRIAVGS